MGDYDGVKLDLLGIGLDIGAALTPGVPGGAGAARLFKLASCTMDVAQLGSAGLQLGADYAYGSEEPDEYAGEGEFAGSSEDPEDLGNCFLAGTLVETASRGPVNVEDVRVGDRIAPPPGHEGCADPHCGEVVRLFRNQTDRVVTITAVARPRARERQSASKDGGEASEEDGEPPSAESSQTIRCTPGHPFFVEGRGWVLAGDLRAGDELEARGESVVVAAVEVHAGQASTFNFEVACHHTYRVRGEAEQPAVLVHNTSLANIVKAGGALARRVRSGSGAAFKAGGRRLGRFLKGVGESTENIADRVLAEVGGLSRVPGEFVAANGRRIDWLLANMRTGARALLELKYAIPTRGQSLARMVGQVQGMAAESGVRRVVWSLRAPGRGAVDRVRRLAGVGEEVEFTHGVRGLYSWLSDFAR